MIRGSRIRIAGLWLHRNFLRLWAAQTISVFGSAITTLALPLTAIAVLHATPGQMGLLFAAGQVPPLLVSLLAGAWVDRLRRRPILILADLGRMLLLGSIPLTMALGFLSLNYLFLINLLVGILSVFFNVAYTSFLPTIIQRQDLVEGNTKLQLTNSLSRIIGPGIAGLLIQLLTAPRAILGDSLSFALSALILGSIRAPETVPAPYHDDQRRSIWAEIGTGLAAVTHNPLLRALAGSHATANFFWGIQLPLLILYMMHDVGMSATLIGIIFASSNIGVLVGVLLTKRVVKRFGLGLTMIGTASLSIIGALLVPVADRSMGIAPVLLAAAQLFTVTPLIIYEINEVSLRQSITPAHLLGRLNATMQFLSWATTPLGALLGGWLAQVIGVRPTLLVAAIGLLFAIPWLLISPLPSLKQLPP